MFVGLEWNQPAAAASSTAVPTWLGIRAAFADVADGFVDGQAEHSGDIPKLRMLWDTEIETQKAFEKP